MIFLSLALKSLRNRRFSASLTVLSIALSIALLLAVERTRRAAEEGFTQSVSQVDLLVGARTGPLNLILYTVFNMGAASNNVSWASYEKYKNDPAIEWTIPYSLGDGHRGFRVVATNSDFYEHYRFRGDGRVELAEGQAATGLWDVVVGSDVEKKLGYKLGDQIVLAHGVTRGEAVQKHEDKPFHVTGILKSTGTALDQSLYISLEGMEAIHVDWKNGAAPAKGKGTPAEQISKESLKVDQITAFFLRAKSRIEILRLQRQINTDQTEPLLAIIPGVTLAELWRGLSNVEQILKIISWMVMGVGLASMLSSILAGLNERRREMAILRSIGAGPKRIAALLVFESALLTLMGLVLGAVLELGGFFLLAGWLEDRFGFYMTGPVLTSNELIYIAVAFASGVFTGLIPALRARFWALKDGLSVRV